jgi:hypothetical protein
MKLSNVKDALKLATESNVTLALVGVSGSGKTSIGKQIYKELGYDDCLVLRPSLMADPSDLTGLYDFEMVSLSTGETVKTTAYAMPKFLPRGDKKILIILDEINRINKDVANAIFGLIEAEGPTIGEYRLPKGSHVIATLNPPTSNYSAVLDFKDNAWSSRMAFVKIVPDLETFTDYGKKTGNVSKLTLDFFNKNPKFFGSGEDFSVEMFGLNAVDNNRSKEKISLLEVNAKKFNINDDVLFELIQGIAGKDMTVAFMEYRKTYGKAISLVELLTNANNEIDSFDYSELSSVSKMLEDANKLIADKTFNIEHCNNLAKFLVRIPLDTMLPFVDHVNDICEEEEQEDIDNAKFRKVIALELDKNDELIERCDMALKIKESTAKVENKESVDDSVMNSDDIPF